MKLPHKILHVIEFLLKKRVQEDGYDTTFSFHISELNAENIYCYNPSEVADLLKAMKNTMVFVRDGEGEQLVINGLKDYKVDIEKGVITPIESNTNALRALRTKVKKDMDKSQVEVDTKKRRARYGQNEWVEFYGNALRWQVFLYIYENWPNQVEIGDLFDNAIFINANEKQKAVIREPGSVRTKFINDIITGLERHLADGHFPDDIFHRVHGVSIKLGY